MPVADTSFLVAFFDRDDRHHHAARSAFAEADQVIILTEVLVEMLGVLKGKLDRRAADSALVDLMRIENVAWQETCDIMAAYRLRSERKTLSIVDAMVIHASVRSGTELLSFDERQKRIARRMLGHSDR
jgi:predicted nucleic acid-binding protein